MFDLAAALPEQVAAAAALGAEVDGLPDRDDDRAGRRARAWAAAAWPATSLAAVAGPFMPVPVTVAKGYEAPAFVGEGTLCFAISYSGDTEETVEAAQAAAGGRGAHGGAVHRRRAGAPGRARGSARTSCSPSARCRGPASAR